MNKLIGFNWHSIEYEFPVTAEPAWKDLVGRWYQLDPYAYGLAQAAHIWKTRLKTPKVIISASRGASNATDHEFAVEGATSPSKFAHTLPNIRCSPLCQVMGWSGTVLCIQKDPETQVHGLIEGIELCAENSDTIWVLNIAKTGAKYVVHGFEILGEGGTFEAQRDLGVGSTKIHRDEDLLAWLKGDENTSVALTLGRYKFLRKVK